MKNSYCIMANFRVDALEWKCKEGIVRLLPVGEGGIEQSFVAQVAPSSGAKFKDGPAMPATIPGSSATVDTDALKLSRVQRQQLRAKMTEKTEAACSIFYSALDGQKGYNLLVTAPPPPVKTCEQSCTECHGYARVPYLRCRCCWDAPSYHHGRCCPKRCWVCREYAAIPFASCDHCGDKPSNHHGRCCSRHPANRRWNMYM